MIKQYDVFHVYGTSSKQNPGPKVRKDNYPKEYDTSEVRDGVLSVTITSFADAPDLAYIEIVAVDEHIGKRFFNRTVYQWQNGFCDKVWTEG